MNQRRNFLQSLFFLPAIANNIGSDSKKRVENAAVSSSLSHRFKISLNAYSFNSPLTKKEITIEEVIDFCGDLNIDAIDITGYYLQNYPEVPSDEYINSIKNRVHKAGLSISGT
ncbi:MAG: hypothetical protein ACR2IM_00240, partial [Sediminibacterium sp.]